MRFKDFLPRLPVVLTASFYQKAQKKGKASPFHTLFNRFMGGHVISSNDPQAFISEGYASSADVYSLVSKIAKKAAGVKWQLFEVKNEKALTQFKMATIDDREFFRSKALELVPGDSGVSQMLKRVNSVMSWNEYVIAEISFYLITGNTFTYGPQLFSNRPIEEMFIMPPQNTDIVVSSTQKRIVEGYRLHGWVDNTLSPEHVLHRKYFNPDYDGLNWLQGQSPLMAARKLLAKNNAGDSADLNAFSNMGASGIISGKANDYPLKPEEKLEMQQSWDIEASGTDNFKKMIVSSTPVEFQRFNLSPIDLGIGESWQISLQRLCNIYDTPIQIMNSEKASTRDNQITAAKQHWTDAIIPQMNWFRDGQNDFWVKSWSEADGKQYYLDYDISGIEALQSDRKTVAKIVYAGMDRGVFNADEVRVALNYPATALPEHQVYEKSAKPLDVGEGDK